MIPNLCRLPVVLSIMVVLELLIIVHLLGLGSFKAFAWADFASLSFYAQWIALPGVWLLCRLRDRLNKMAPTSVTLLVLMIVLALTALVNLLFANFVFVNSHSITQQQALRDMVIVAVICCLGLRYCFVQQRWLEEERAKESARFSALQARIQPHFLFNTLNSIASLVQFDVDKADRAIQDLSGLLRRQINVDQQFVLWQEEKELCEAYIRIETLRYGDRLRVDWDVASVPDDFRIMPLMIQPLIENAVRYGIAPSAEQAVVAVKASLLGASDKALQKADDNPQSLTIAIENSVSTEFRPYASASLIADPEQSEGHGIALSNVQARIRSMYRDPDSGELLAGLRVEQPSGKYRVVLTFSLSAISSMFARQTVK